MLTKHFSHLLYEPKQSLVDADRTPARLADIVIHTAMLALIPTVCGFIATAYIGWNIGAETPFTMAQDKALTVAVLAYIAFNAGVYSMGYAIYWLSQTFNRKPTMTHCLELALFASVPLFLSGFIALYPLLILDILTGLLALAAAVYLLYTGLPIFMHIPPDKGFIYSTWVVAMGLIILVLILGVSVFLFSVLN